MTGIPLLNAPAFNRAAAALREAGHEVVSPLELDVGAGIDPETIDVHNTTHLRRDAMSRDLPLLVACDDIAYLPGSHLSEGCRVEGVVARYLGIREMSVFFDTEGQLVYLPHH
jgi:hypothetical protein